MARKKLTAERKAQLETYLHEYLDDVTTVYCAIRRISKSGMTRIVGLFVVDDDRKIIPIHHLVAEYLDYTYDRDDCGVKVGADGIEPGWELVYGLNKSLYPGAVDRLRREWL